MKRFNSSWEAKTLKVNFNQKQWRQDIAAWIRDCNLWPSARVTRSKIVSEEKDKVIKEFKIFNENDSYFYVKYSEENHILESSNSVLTEEYMMSRV